MECIQLFLTENRKCEVFRADAGTFSHRAEGKQGSDVVRAGMNRGDEVVCREDIPPDASERGVRAAVEALRILIREDGAQA